MGKKSAISDSTVRSNFIKTRGKRKEWTKIEVTFDKFGAFCVKISPINSKLDISKVGDRFYSTDSSLVESF